MLRKERRPGGSYDPRGDRALLIAFTELLPTSEQSPKRTGAELVSTSKVDVCTAGCAARQLPGPTEAAFFLQRHRLPLTHLSPLVIYPFRQALDQDVAHAAPDTAAHAEPTAATPEASHDVDRPACPGPETFVLLAFCLPYHRSPIGIHARARCPAAEPARDPLPRTRLPASPSSPSANLSCRSRSPHHTHHTLRPPKASRTRPKSKPGCTNSRSSTRSELPSCPPHPRPQRPLSLRQTR